MAAKSSFSEDKSTSDKENMPVGRKTRKSQSGGDARQMKNKAEDMFSGEYLKSRTTISTTELSKRLTRLSKTLMDMDSHSNLDAVRNLVGELVSTKNVYLFDHKDQHLRLLLSCCFVDILRIFAPDVPFSKQDLREVFLLVLGQLKQFGSKEGPESSDRHFHLLESLATVKSCILVIGLDPESNQLTGLDGNDDQDDEENTEMAVLLFRYLLDILQEDHSTKVESYILSIMQSIVEESEHISRPLLEVILGNLIETGTPRYRLAQNLIHRTSDVLQSDLSLVSKFAMMERHLKGILSLTESRAPRVFRK